MSLLEGTLNGLPALIEPETRRAALLPQTYTLLRTEMGIVGAIGASGKRILTILLPIEEGDKWSVTIQHDDPRWGIDGGQH